jgi:nicotinamidase-related amidase
VNAPCMYLVQLYVPSKDIGYKREAGVLEFDSFLPRANWAVHMSANESLTTRLSAGHARVDKLSIRPTMTALLLMDFQRMAVDSYAVDKAALLGRVKRLAMAVRSCGAMVIHVVVGFQLGYPEVSGRNSVFSSLKAAGLLATGDPSAKIHPELTPLSGDVVVTKQRVSAFTGTNLDMILRSNNIDTLLLTGILTQGVVLSTLRHAADMDYRTVVVADGCSDKDPEVQRVLMEKVFPFQSKVSTVEECIGAIP